MQIVRSLRGLIVLVPVIGLFAGCAGYQVGPTKPAEFQHINTIAVPTFKNDTLEPRIGTQVTGAVVKQLQNDGTYAISSLDNSDAILRGTITRIDRRQLRSARFNTLRSRELRVTMEIDYVIEEAGTGVTLDRGTVRGDTNMFLDPNFQLTERQAIDEMSREVATELVDRIAEGWPGETGNVGGFTEQDRRAMKRMSEGNASGDPLERDR